MPESIQRPLWFCKRFIILRSQRKKRQVCRPFLCGLILYNPHDLLPEQDVLFINGFVVMIMAEQPVVVFCSFLDRKLDAIRAAGEGGTVAHVLPEDELPMNATGLETLDSI